MAYRQTILLCRLRSIAAHRDHFVRCPSVCPSVCCLSVCLSGSHTFLVVTHSYVSQATNAFLRILPLCLMYNMLCSSQSKPLLHTKLNYFVISFIQSHNNVLHCLCVMRRPSCNIVNISVSVNAIDTNPSNFNDENHFGWYHCFPVKHKTKWLMPFLEVLHEKVCLNLQNVLYSSTQTQMTLSCQTNLA